MSTSLSCRDKHGVCLASGTIQRLFSFPQYLTEPKWLNFWRASNASAPLNVDPGSCTLPEMQAQKVKAIFTRALTGPYHLFTARSHIVLTVWAVKGYEICDCFGSAPHACQHTQHTGNLSGKQQAYTVCRFKIRVTPAPLLHGKKPPASHKMFRVIGAPKLGQAKRWGSLHTQVLLMPVMHTLSKGRSLRGCRIDPSMPLEYQRARRLNIRSLTNPHDDLPGDMQMFAQLIIKMNIFLQTIPVDSEESQTVGSSILDVPSILRQSKTAGNRLLGYVEVRLREDLESVELDRRVFSLQLNKVNPDGPALELSAGFSVSEAPPLELSSFDMSETPMNHIPKPLWIPSNFG
ncbi:hypothetical protein K438DRAFT_1766418 [Mycena galopus ATCC 62051]|nr:hypothetical protein K438DRAFT_1766418 [Mycena galopus ATCC 62051]